MSISVIAGMAWCVLANFLGMLPSKRHHWPQAYLIIALGMPVLVWIAFSDGWVLALIFLLAAMSILRWPVRYLWRWVYAVWMRFARR